MTLKTNLTTTDISLQRLSPESRTIVVMSDTTVARLSNIAEQRWGLLTTAQATEAGVSRNQLSRMAANGVLERVSQGVYRMAGAPRQENEVIYAAWLALGGATTPRTTSGVASVVAAGVTAASAHGIGDFFLGLDFIVPSRRGTRLPEVRLRVRTLAPREVVAVNGLPTLTVERTIADLVEQRHDLSLVAGVVRDAVASGRLLSPKDLVAYLEPLARRTGTHDGHELADKLFDLAGIAPEGWRRG
jgi:hypothetical protein